MPILNIGCNQLQALRRLERAERRAQTDIDREHAADPDNGAEYVQGEGDGGHERDPGSRNARLRAGLYEAWRQREEATRLLYEVARGGQPRPSNAPGTPRRSRTSARCM
jgi:hypothetical protein